MFITIIVVNLLRGTKRSPSIIGIETCSYIDWSLYTVNFLVIILTTIVGSIYLRWVYLRKLKCDYTFLPGDVKWTGFKIVLMIFIGFIVGVLAGALGLGGGVIYNPLFLELGIDPQVASSTGMYLVMLTSLTNTILYAVQGHLKWDWGVWLAAFTIIGSIVGLKAIAGVIKKTGRSSILVFVLGFVLVLSALVIPLYSGINMVIDYRDGKNIF